LSLNLIVFHLVLFEFLLKVDSDLLKKFPKFAFPNLRIAWFARTISVSCNDCPQLSNGSFVSFLFDSPSGFQVSFLFEDGFKLDGKFINAFLKSLVLVLLILNNKLRPQVI